MKIGLPHNQWVKKLEMAPLQQVGFFALLKKQADLHERSQGLRSSFGKLSMEHSEAT
jgi:hypothetical protein